MAPRMLLTGNIRHYSYECKATAQERPYKARPSRTQQLLNPTLVPKLSEDVQREPGDTAGLADKILAGREADRGTTRHSAEIPGDLQEKSPRRARSLSSNSVDSVSTISTNRSASASRERSSRRASDALDRGGSASPLPTGSRKRRYSDASEDASAKSYSSHEKQRSLSREWTEDRNIRRRRRESSPEERGRHRATGTHDSRKSDRRSRSLEKSRIAKQRRSMTPDAAYEHSDKRTYRDRGSLERQSQADRARQTPRTRGGPPRERSLSPYSKRIALTQSMNLGR
ncbi:hypothetical protein N7539_004547 [Penicillium diatomitis]|uniref:Zinc knuckle-domain-containing protein n=1 Tax=Penicillium diatomitis TaxID=2819901 RepID=A0A9X0BYW1_9EURO|nr:uncharacterized protein N7539_004547 [Penicillium diatomitis]KAJ5489657.1 hypothetical protein N7539_004547 [Penicillium diatomitis]